jgi:peptidoglycan-associated lipoprotein
MIGMHVRLKAGALIVLMLLASGCARNVTTPGAPDPGFSGLGPGDGALGAVTGGTLPGTNISDRVLFLVDQSTLGGDAIGTLNAQIGWLMQNPGTPIEIQGHADERGTGEYNMALGSSRASAVRNYMVSQGIPDSRISIITFGRERPVATCPDESCFAQNRRAVTVVTGPLTM